MNGNLHQRLRPIGLKVSEEAFHRLRSLADQSGKPLAEWCRDKVLEAVKPKGPSASEHALMAEISATQAILIDLVCALGSDGKLSQQKAQAVVDAATARSIRRLPNF